MFIHKIFTMFLKSKSRDTLMTISFNCETVLVVKMLIQFQLTVNFSVFSARYIIDKQ